MMYTDGAQCTGNFVFTDSAGHTYLGYAAHCAGRGSSTDTNGCRTDSVPLRTKVDLSDDGNLASEGTIVGHGTLAYSSWITEHQLGTGDANTCAYNDLALVRLDPADLSKVNPSVPFWGGPAGIDTDGTAAGDQVWTYGSSSLRGGASALSPHTGVSLGDDPADGGWSHPLYTLTPGIPGIPGDSGSGFMTRGGRAVGSSPRSVWRRSRPRTTSATWPRSWPSPSSTPASPACSWSTGRSRSTRSCDGPSDDGPVTSSGGGRHGATVTCS